MSEDFPFVGSVSETASTGAETEDLPLLTEYAWDFNTDKFLYDGDGHHIIVTGKEALKVWIYKGQVLPRAKKAPKSAEGGK